MLSDSDLAAIEAVRSAVADAVRRLEAAGVAQEALGEVVVPRKLLGLGREPRIERRGAVWRLGALLLSRDGGVWATGGSTRVREPGRAQGLHASVEERRALRQAAIVGGFALGEVVNHDATPIAIDETLIDPPAPAVLAIRDGIAWVRWGVTATERTRLEPYLSDLLDLAEHPPGGA